MTVKPTIDSVNPSDPVELRSKTDLMVNFSLLSGVPPKGVVARITIVDDCYCFVLENGSISKTCDYVVELTQTPILVSLKFIIKELPGISNPYPPVRFQVTPYKQTISGLRKTGTIDIKHFSVTSQPIDNV